MPSRKRAKGKERKLKQQAQAQETAVEQRRVTQRQVLIPGSLLTADDQGDDEISVPDVCKHGLVRPDERQHPVHRFMDSFGDRKGTNLPRGNDNVTESMKLTFQRHQEVWDDPKMKKWVIEIMVGIGTGFIVDKNYIVPARQTCEAVLLLEHYNGEGTFYSALSKASEDITYMRKCGKRDVIHFYKKRLQCSCLDEMYSEIKKIEDRVSECFHCKQKTKRRYLRACSRCKCTLYCSQECQQLDWPYHREWCKQIRPIHKNTKK